MTKAVECCKQEQGMGAQMAFGQILLKISYFC